MHTRAAVVYEQNQPVVIESLYLDNPKPHEVVVRMVATGVCHSDRSVLDGTIPYQFPVVIGHEGAGIVERVGEDVTYVQPGDHVVLAFVSACGKCRMCLRNRHAICQGITARRGYLLDDTTRLRTADGQEVRQMSRIGTMSEYIVASEQALVKIDQRYDLKTAVLVGCGVTTGVGAVLNTAKVEPGSWVAVIGAGGVGLNAIQGARLADAERIIAVDRVASKLALAQQFGATDLVDASKVDAVEAVRGLTGGQGVDYAFEVIGNPTTVEQAYQLLRAGGTAVIVGLTRVEAKISLPPQNITVGEKRLIGSYYGSVVPRADMPKLLRWYDEGKLKLDELISQTYRLEQINDAFAALDAGQNVRGVIVYE